MTDEPKIVGVAMRHEDGRLWTLPAPNRHHHLIRHLVETGVKNCIGSEFEQGFVDSLGRFCGRRQALAVALKAGQLIGAGDLGKLYSEDVW